MFARPTSVKHTRDFDRVVSLPRRRILAADADRWAGELTKRLRARRSRGEIRRWQALALHEIIENGGGWLALPVGLGKTLISYLVMVLAGAERPMIIGPSNLEAKTRDDFAAYVDVWRDLENPYRYVSFEDLRNAKNDRLLLQHRPDWVVIEEADGLANAERSAALRIDRMVLELREEVHVVCQTGTPGRNSILDYWHLLCWCLRNRAPVPMTRDEAKTWAAALDAKPGRDGNIAPGPLGRTRKLALDWYRHRLIDTPGVVIVDEDSCDQPLTITLRPAREDVILDKAFDSFMIDQETPCGISVTDPLSRFDMGGRLGCGLYKYWDPPPPDAWRKAYRAHARFVRRACQRSRNTAKPLDTESQVDKRYAGHPIVATWRELKPKFKGKTKARWLSDSALKSVKDWLRESSEPGAIWVGSTDFGLRLAKRLGLEYYGREGLSLTGIPLHQAPKGVSFVASWHSNKKGFCLEAWSRALIVMPPASAKWLEQTLGRHHRSGQRRPVFVSILLTSGATLDAFSAALAEASFDRESHWLTQKILRAKIVRAKIPTTSTNEFRWIDRETAAENDRKKVRRNGPNESILQAPRTRQNREARQEVRRAA